MRLFSALEVSEPVADALAALQGGLHDVRWVDPEDFHLTLAFIGEVGRPVAEELAVALSELQASPFDLRVTGFTAFGADRPHALVALIERTPPLMALAAAHRSVCKTLGIGDTERKYMPHITLARMRRGSATEAAGWLSMQSALGLPTWQPSRFALFSARTSRGGGPYVAEVGFPFVGA